MLVPSLLTKISTHVGPDRHYCDINAEATGRIRGECGGAPIVQFVKVLSSTEYEVDVKVKFDNIKLAPAGIVGGSSARVTALVAALAEVRSRGSLTQLQSTANRMTNQLSKQLSRSTRGFTRRVQTNLNSSRTGLSLSLRCRTSRS